MQHHNVFLIVILLDVKKAEKCLCMYKSIWFDDVGVALCCVLGASYMLNCFQSLPTSIVSRADLGH